jgi:uncharacterized Tic20 family protein
MTTDFGTFTTEPQVHSQPAMWAHLSALGTWLLSLIFAPFVLCCWVGPVIIRARYPEDMFVRHHTGQAMNASFTGLIVGLGGLIAGFVLILIGVGFSGSDPVLTPVFSVPGALIIVAGYVLAIARIVCGIKGTVAASNSRPYYYPSWVAFRFVKD